MPWHFGGANLEGETMKVMSEKTLVVNGGEIELVFGLDGRFHWFLGNEDTEVSGESVAEATEAAYRAWPEAEQLNYAG